MTCRRRTRNPVQVQAVQFYSSLVDQMGAAMYSIARPRPGSAGHGYWPTAGRGPITCRKFGRLRLFGQFVSDKMSCTSTQEFPFQRSQRCQVPQGVSIQETSIQVSIEVPRAHNQIILSSIVFPRSAVHTRKLGSKCPSSETPKFQLEDRRRVLVPLTCIIS
jgi:hypothetical protein